MEPMTSMVPLVSPRPFTSSLSCRLWMSQSVAAAGVGGLVSVLTALLEVCVVAGDPPAKAAFRLYPNIRKNSSADLRGSRIKSDITATESAPASMTDRQLSRVIPPMATNGL